MHTYIRKYAHTDIHTYIHTYIYTHTLFCLKMSPRATCSGTVWRRDDPRRTKQVPNFVLRLQPS